MYSPDTPQMAAVATVATLDAAIMRLCLCLRLSLCQPSLTRAEAATAGTRWDYSQRLPQHCAEIHHEEDERPHATAAPMGLYEGRWGEGACYGKRVREGREGHRDRLGFPFGGLRAAADANNEHEQRLC